MNCAIISLPLPLSPVMKTEASVGATLRASSIARRNAGAVPSRVILSLCACRRSNSSCCSRVSRATASVCTARPIKTWRWEAENGFGR
ncbi:MAG: hypothetical protein DMD52_07750 [Gemmatimonadetes bacterium]|nr:MAG: hypothetical protein DMD52_07750 [Gemmatimonadota bacterium]